MTEHKITREQLDATLEEVVAEYGEDYIYESPDGTGCKYIELNGDGSIDGPGCLIGHALVALGVDPEYLKSGDALGYGARSLNVWADAQVAQYAVNIQQRQDVGDTWGVSVALGDQRVLD